MGSLTTTIATTTTKPLFVGMPEVKDNEGVFWFADKAYKSGEAVSVLLCWRSGAYSYIFVSLGVSGRDELEDVNL